MKIYERLRSERKRLGLTQTAVAKVCGVSLHSISDYESGKSEPKLSVLESLTVLGVDVMYILTGNRTLPAIMSVEEQKLVENYRAMDDSAKLNIQAVGDAFAQSKPNLKTG